MALWWRPSLSLGGLSRSSPDGAGRARSADSCAAASRISGRAHVRILRSSCRRPSTVASDDARLSRRSSAAQQGRALSSDPPTVEEIVAVMRIAGDGLHGRRLRGLIVGGGSRARASVPTPAGRATAHSSADGAHRQSQSSSHARAGAGAPHYRPHDFRQRLTFVLGPICTPQQTWFIVQRHRGAEPDAHPTAVPCSPSSVRTLDTLVTS